MIFVVLNEAAECGELLLVDGGMCRFHIRRDRVLVIREIIVLPDRRRQGVGSKLVHAACKTHSGLVVARCPVPYPANAFWRALGFTLHAVINDINEWRLDLS